MPSTDVATTEEAPSDPGVPTSAPGPYDGVEPDKVTGGFFWWNDPLNPGNDVEPNAEYAAAVEAALNPEEAPEEALADA